MTRELSPQSEQYLASVVAGGLFPSQEAALEAAIAAFREKTGFQLDNENLDHFFTPERLALIDQAAADVAAGNVHSMDQVREDLGRTRDAWLRDHASGK